VNFHKTLYDAGAGSVMHYYHNSPSLLISTVFPEYEWLPWKFVGCPKHYWEDVNHQKKFIHWAAKQLNFKEMSDWYKVTQKVEK
jgi:hypothetical protein